MATLPQTEQEYLVNLAARELAQMIEEAAREGLTDAFSNTDISARLWRLPTGPESVLRVTAVDGTVLTITVKVEA